MIPVSLRHHIVNTWDQYPRLEPLLIAAGTLHISKLEECSLRLLDARITATWLIERLHLDPSIILPEQDRPSKTTK